MTDPIVWSCILLFLCTLGAGNTRSGSPSQQGYRDVGLHERVHIPPDSRKARWTIIQPQHPANLNAAAPSFQSKIRSGSARLWHSACSLSLPRSQSRKCSLSETVSEDHPRSTSRRDGINQATWDEHHNVQKTSLSREHEQVFGLRVGNSSTRNWQHKDELNERSLELAIMTRSADKSAKRWKWRPATVSLEPRLYRVAAFPAHVDSSMRSACSARGRAHAHGRGAEMRSAGSTYRRERVAFARANKLFLRCDRALDHVENSLRIADDGKSAAWKKKDR